jgi:DNA replication protein DnaC
MDNLDQEFKDLIERVQAQMETGLPSSEIPFNHDCELCGDTGWILHLDEYGNRSSEKCRCLLAREAGRRIRNSGLSHVIDNWTLDSFATDQPHQKRMKDTVTAFISAVQAGEKPWLFIGGAVGSGKSHLCTAACGELLKYRFSVRYFQWLTDARRMKSIITDHDSYEDQLARYTRADILYIDDLFKSKRGDQDGLSPSDADVRLAFELINGRYVENKIVVISSEWLLTQELLAVDEGTFSRVYERSKGYRVEIKREEGRNYRIDG